MIDEKEKSRFSIDPENLDQEWIVQAQLAYKIHVRIAELEFELSDAKRNFEFVESKLGLEIREQFAFEKVTEAKIKSEVNKHPDYQAAYERENQAQRSLGLAKSAGIAIEHKKRALENLVYLRKQEYYSNPVTPDSPPRPKAAGVSKQS
jgi:hypothetical protein